MASTLLMGTVVVASPASAATAITTITASEATTDVTGQFASANGTYACSVAANRALKISVTLVQTASNGARIYAPPTRGWAIDLTCDGTTRNWSFANYPINAGSFDPNRPAIIAVEAYDCPFDGGNPLSYCPRIAVPGGSFNATYNWNEFPVTIAPPPAQAEPFTPLVVPANLFRRDAPPNHDGQLDVRVENVGTNTGTLTSVTVIVDGQRRVVGSIPATFERQTVVTVEGLTNGQTYTFVAEVCNSLGNCSTSAPVTQAPWADPIPAAYTATVDGTTITFTWEASVVPASFPTTARCIILGRGQDVSDTFSFDTMAAGSGTVQGIPGMTYEIRSYCNALVPYLYPYTYRYGYSTVKYVTVPTSSTPAPTPPATATLGIKVLPTVKSWDVNYVFAHRGKAVTVTAAIRPARVATLSLQTSTDRKTWKTLVRKSTDAKGNATYSYTPSATLVYRWVFAGDAATAAVKSSGVRSRLYPQAVRYSSCAELRKVYPNGVGKPNAVDMLNGKPRTNGDRVFLPSLAAYNANNWTRTGDRDADDDGIACES